MRTDVITTAVPALVFRMLIFSRSPAAATSWSVYSSGYRGKTSAVPSVTGPSSDRMSEPEETVARTRFTLDVIPISTSALNGRYSYWEPDSGLMLEPVGTEERTLTIGMI